MVTSDNLKTKFFLKLPYNIIKFFKSSIGPRIKKPASPLNEFEYINDFQTNASASEQSDKINPRNIINNIVIILLFDIDVRSA